MFQKTFFFLLFQTFVILAKVCAQPPPLPPNPYTPCVCEYLIHRSNLDSECGRCARCWWNLYYYANTFSPANGTLTALATEYYAKMSACATLVPSHPNIDVNVAGCQAPYLNCLNVTSSSFFIHQCDAIYGKNMENKEHLGPPDPVSVENYVHYTGKIVNWTQPEKFHGGKQKKGKETFYPRTCPSHHRSYEFTFYLLFAGASVKYGLHPQPPWDETLSFSKVGELIPDASLEEFDRKVHCIFSKNFGYADERSLDKRKFCGHRDVFVCVDKTKGKHGHVHKIHYNEKDCT